MIYKVNSDKLIGNLLKVVNQVLTKEFQDDGLCASVSTDVLISMAAKHVRELRDKVVLYDNLHRTDDLKPCKNYRMIADRIVEELEHELQCSHIPRAYAYKTLFIMYLLFERMPSSRCRSWWEKKFMRGLPDYLESTDYFKGIDCKYRLSVVLDQLPDPGGRLPLEIPIVMPKPRPHYPPLERPIVILNNPSFHYGEYHIEKMENTNCQQFYAQVSNSAFQH